MSKLNLTDLSQQLMDKHGLDRREAAYFVEAIVKTLHDGLEADKLVKIKGLGTFKIVGVGARESVNIHTGERVTINRHSKLTFTPDAAMKELVNRPFSQFETVVLNDGVEFDDMPQQEDDGAEPDSLAETLAEEEQEQPQEADAEPVAEPEVVPEIETDEPQPEQETEQEDEPEDEPEPEPEPVAQADVPATDQPAPATPFPWLWMLVAALIGFGLGFLFARMTAGSHVDGQKQDKVVYADTVETTEPVVDSLANVPDTLTPAENPTIEVDNQEESAGEEEVQNVPTEPFDSQKYEDMDARVRLGAYRIIGVQETAKARAGETVKQISRRYLGPDMECYVEVLNGLKGNDKLTGGQEVKIPKLEWKRKK